MVEIDDTAKEERKSNTGQDPDVIMRKKGHP